MNKQINNCIGCDVASCQYHHDVENYCTLSQIHVTTHESNPKMVECTDCGSFEARLK